MQTACRDAVYSNDYLDILLDYRGVYNIGDPVCIQRLNETFDVAYYPREGNPPLNLKDYVYLSIPKCFGLMDQSALEVSGILRLQNPDGLDLRGSGVLVGFIDTGIDYAHPAFRNTDGSTRILGIWDQTIADGIPPEGFLYGGFYDKDQINDALRRENPTDFVPVTDEIGHGTFLAGAACGSEDLEHDFIGAAPLCAIAVVKCKPAKQYLRDFFFIRGDVPCYQENDIMAGIAWLNKFAYEKQMPLVLCIGMGSSMGSHSGEEPIALMCDWVGRSRQRAVVTAAGNEANTRHHYAGSGIVEGQTDAIEISVGENISGFYLELWAAVPELYQISVLSPTGERLPKVSVSLGEEQKYTFLFEDTRLTVSYSIVGARLGSQLIYLQFEKPLPGIWTLEVSAQIAISGSFHCWLPQQEFVSGSVFFLRSNPDMTITAPGYSVTSVTTGAYRSFAGSVYPGSGRGYSFIGGIKPDILAPGVNVYGTEPGGGYGVRTGTSISAAVTAGACAQLLEWGVVQNRMIYWNSTDIANLLVRGAVRSPERTYPNPVYGYGLLDVYEAFVRMQR